MIMTKRGKVRVETGGESPRTYDVGRGEEVSVRTRYEKPEVTGGGGGGDFSIGGCLFAIIIIIVLIVKMVSCSINAVEVNVIKRIDPDYITYREAAEKEKIEQAKIAEKKAKRIADERI